MLLVSNVRAFAERNSLPGHGLLDSFFFLLKFKIKFEQWGLRSPDWIGSYTLYLLSFYVDINWLILITQGGA